MNLIAETTQMGWPEVAIIQGPLIVFLLFIGWMEYLKSKNNR